MKRRQRQVDYRQNTALSSVLDSPELITELRKTLSPQTMEIPIRDLEYRFSKRRFSGGPTIRQRIARPIPRPRTSKLGPIGTSAAMSGRGEGKCQSCQQ